MKNSIKDIYSTIRYSISFLLCTDKIYLLLKISNVIFSALNNVLIVLLPGYIIDSLNKSKDYQSALFYLGILILTMILNTVVGSLIEQEISVRKIRLNSILSKKILKTTAKMEYDILENSSTLDEFEFAKTCISESHIINSIDMIFDIIKNIASLSAYIYIVFKYSLFFIPIILLTIIVNAISQSKKESLYVKVQEDSAALNRKISYASRNLTDYEFAKEIRLFNLKRFIFNKYNHFIVKMYGLEYEFLRKVLPVHIIVALVGALQIIVAYGIIGYSLYMGKISIGVFVQYSSAFLALSTAITEVISSFVKLKTDNKFILSYEEYLRKHDLSNETNKPVHVSDNYEIELCNVSFKYPMSDDFVLKNLNAKFSKNEKIAIVGTNGAGKTTLIKLLLGFYKPTEGEILLNGRNIADIPSKEYLEYFSAVFQDCSILNYSVAENISFSETYSENRINEILYSLNMEDKVNSFKYGLDTSITRMLDAEGSDISGGERQKLVIARALYKNTPICMFDEPTSALSATSEYNIYKSFSDLTENKTVFYISHRLASCKLCEKIILLNKGQIKESGSFDELMSKNGLFTEMYNAQAEYYRN